jgi:hypothetical protein
MEHFKSLSLAPGASKETSPSLWISRKAQTKQLPIGKKNSKNGEGDKKEKEKQLDCIEKYNHHWINPNHPLDWWALWAGQRVSLSGSQLAPLAVSYLGLHYDRRKGMDWFALQGVTWFECQRCRQVVGYRMPRRLLATRLGKEEEPKGGELPPLEENMDII